MVLYSALLFVLVIYWVMSLDPNWYSTIYGFQYLVGQAFMVLPLAMLTLIGLSKAEPIKSTFHVIEQHDIGKLCFALVMLNIYFAFGAFIIIWSGNSPEEIPWYLDRIRGGWGVIATLDVILHWLIPFSSAAVAGSEADPEPAGGGVRDHDVRGLLGFVLAD